MADETNFTPDIPENDSQLRHNEQIAVTDTIDEHLINYLSYLEVQTHDFMEDVQNIASQKINELTPEKLLEKKKEVNDIFNSVNKMKQEAKKALDEVNVASLSGVGFNTYQEVSKEFEDTYEKFYSEWFRLYQEVQDNLQPYIKAYDEKRAELEKKDIQPETPVETVMQNTEELLENVAGTAITEAVRTESSMTNPLKMVKEVVRGQDSIERATENVKGIFNPIMDEAITIAEDERSLKKEFDAVKGQPHNIQTVTEINDIKESALANNDGTRKLSHVAVFFKGFGAAIRADFEDTRIGKFLTDRKEFMAELHQRRSLEKEINNLSEELQDAIKYSNYFSTQIEKQTRIRDIEIQRNIKPIERLYENAKKEAALGSPVVVYNRAGKMINEPVYDGKPLPFPYKNAFEWATSKEGRDAIAVLGEHRRGIRAQIALELIDRATAKYTENVKSPNSYLFQLKEASIKCMAEAVSCMDKITNYDKFPDIERAAKELRLPGYSVPLAPSVENAVTEFLRTRNALERTADKGDEIDVAQTTQKLDRLLNDRLNEFGDEFGDALKSRLKTLRLTKEREYLEKVRANRSVAEQKKTRGNDIREQTPVR